RAAATIFDIASLSKPFGTTLAMMSLIERGAINLDAPLGRYLKEFKGAAFEQVTIRRVMTHSAGFPAIPSAESLAGGFPRAARALAAKPLDSPPGTGFQYSDTGSILLGEVVRRVSGDTLDDYLARAVFRPLGLRDTTFHPDERQRRRSAATEFHNGIMLQGHVHDPRARHLVGVAGHAGMFSTAADLARICRMLVNDGELDGKRILKASTVQMMWQRSPQPDGVRTLGWDVSSSFSGLMSPFFPVNSVGHTGFTGTAVWIDPPTRTYMIVLTDRVHPNGGGTNQIRELRSRVAAAACAELFFAPAALVTGPSSSAPAADGGEALTTPKPPRTLGTVRTGLDTLVDQNFAPFQGHAVGLITNQTGIDSKGRRAIDLFANAPGVRLAAIFSPEHGISGDVDTDVPNSRDAATGRLGEGPVMDPDLKSFTAPHPLPVRTGLTIGEYARMVVAERRLPVSLTVFPLVGWDRGRWYDETGLPWANPSPNIRSLTQALLYSGIGLLEATNLSVGRGTEAPFEVVGAPWIEPHALADALNRQRLPGVRFEAVQFTPTSDVYTRTPCSGVRFVVTDRETIRPVTVAFALANALRALHREQFRPEGIQNLLVHRTTMWAFLRGEPLDRLVAWTEVDRTSFMNRRASYLIYP